MKINELLEDASAGASGAGSMAPVEVPLGAVITRGAPATKKRKRKYANAVDTAKYTELQQTKD